MNNPECDNPECPEWTGIEFHVAQQTMVEGTRGRRRQRAHWRHGVMEDIQGRGLGFSEALALTNGRVSWRKYARPYRRDGAEGRD